MKAIKYTVQILILLIFGSVICSGKIGTNDSNSYTTATPSLLSSELYTTASGSIEKFVASLDSERTWAKHKETLGGLKDLEIVVAIDIEKPETVEKYGLTQELLQTQTEQQLKKRGIKITTIEELVKSPEKPTLFLYINVNAQVLKDFDIAPVNTSLRFLQVVSLARSPHKFCLAATWQKDAIQFGLISSLKEVSVTVSELVDAFVTDYLAVNPKEQPKERESTKPKSN